MTDTSLDPEVVLLRTTPNGSTDGRHARSERSRQKMVDALLALLREGVVRPSSAQIAERAGVTQRTLFNQFGDMDSLVAAVVARMAEQLAPLLPEGGAGTVEQRVRRYCDNLTLLLEETMPIRWAVVTNPSPDWAGARMLAVMRQLMRARLEDAFGPELDALDDEPRLQLLDTLEVETDPVTWRLRRVQLGQDVARARAGLERSLLAHLRAAAPGATASTS